MLLRHLATISLVTVIASSCAGSTTGPGSTASIGSEPIILAASIYPIAEIISRVGGDHVDVLNLTPPGTEAHDAEITAKQMERLNDAALAFYFGHDFQPSVQKAISTTGVDAVDLLDSTRTMFIDGTKNVDPHVWLDPDNMISMTRTVTARLVAERPALADEFNANSSRYVAELESLGTYLDSSLTRCESPVLVTAHRSFSYFAARARLQTHSLLDFSGEDSATTKDLEDFAAFLKTKNVTTVFYEESISRESMRVVADMVGASTSTLFPIETVSRAEIAAGDNYISLQEENITRIAKGLRCT